MESPGVGTHTWFRPWLSPKQVWDLCCLGSLLTQGGHGRDQVLPRWFQEDLDPTAATAGAEGTGRTQVGQWHNLNFSGGGGVDCLCAFQFF